MIEWCLQELSIKCLLQKHETEVSQRRFTLQRGSSFLLQLAKQPLISSGIFYLYTFLEKGGEQDENSRLGNENLKRVHIDGVIEEIRNRKIYDKQHRKR